MRRWLLPAVPAVVAVLAGCAHAPADTITTPVDPEAPATVLRAGDRWVVESVATDAPCVRLRVDDVATACTSASEFDAGGWSVGIARGRGKRFALLVGSVGATSARWWSSRAAGVPIEPVTFDTLTVIVVELADGEDPFGIQLLGADGSLIAAVPLTGG